MSLSDHAVTYAGLGLEIFPVGPDKTPHVSQLKATTELDQIEAWWRRWPDALIGHRISPHHLLLDIDPRHNGKATWAALKREALETELRTRTHYSGREDGGGHVWFQRPADKLTQTKLDAWAKERGLGAEIADGQRWTSGIDLLRHEHRYTILPPSPHPTTGKPYRWGKGRGLNIEPVSMPALLAELLTADELPAPEPSGPRFRNPDSIADWFSDTHEFGPLLASKGWVCVAGDGSGDGSRWRHPEATTAVSATIRHGCLFVYSTNTPFEPTSPGEPHGYTPFAAWAVLEHGGDQATAGKAARQLKSSGVSTELTSDRRNGSGDTSGGRRSASEDESEAERQVAVTWANTIELRRVKWCWDGRLALGTLGLLAGPEGLGKSTVACWIGSQLTKGELPGEHYGTPKPVLVCATEDSWSHTIAPRFLAAGADLSKVGRMEVHTEAGLTLPIEFPTDEARFASFVAELQPALVIFDPLISRLNRKLDSHRDGEVRTALEPLVAIADRTGMAMLGLIHHNKSGKTDPLDLVMASKAFTAVARSVHTVVRDPDDESGVRRFFGTPKNNLGTIDLPTKPFIIQAWGYETTEGKGVTGQLQWGQDHGERIDAILRRAQQKAEGRETKGDRAVAWLRDYLEGRGGQAEAADAKAAFRAEFGDDPRNPSVSTLEHNVKRLAHVEKAGFQGVSQWRLCTSQNGPQHCRGCEIARLTTTCENGVPVSQEDSISQSRMSPPAHARTRGDEHASGSRDPESENLDPELHAPDGTPWCRPDGKGVCRNGSRCLNPTHKGGVGADEL